MSQDDRTDDARMRDHQNEIEDGLIHEWLDGELDAVQGAQLEALVASSPGFAARVAEARGLLAASSRILASLDDVPGSVLPRVAASGTVSSVSAGTPLAARSAARTTSRRWSARRWTGIAALLMVGVTGVVVARREPELSRVQESVTPASNGTEDMGAAVRVGASLDSPSAVASDSLAASGLAIADAVRAEPEASALAAAPATELSSENRARESSATDARLQSTRSLTVTPPTASAPVSAPASAPVSTPASPAPLQGRAAASQAKAASANADADMRNFSQMAPQTQVTPQSRMSAAQGGFAVDAARQLMSAEPSVRLEAVPVPPSDIAASDLLLAVQRVRCAPVCEQVRIEIARDGRVRRWRQSLGSSGAPDTATLTENARLDLSRVVDELRLDTLPTMLRLDGAQCRSVGSLRESLRVEFLYNDQLQRVMGLPWCSDGTHALDKAAAAIEAAADRVLSQM